MSGKRQEPLTWLLLYLSRGFFRFPGPPSSNVFLCSFLNFNFCKLKKKRKKENIQNNTLQNKKKRKKQFLCSPPLPLIVPWILIPWCYNLTSIMFYIVLQILHLLGLRNCDIQHQLLHSTLFNDIYSLWQLNPASNLKFSSP